MSCVTVVTRFMKRSPLLRLMTARPHNLSGKSVKRNVSSPPTVKLLIFRDVCHGWHYFPDGRRHVAFSASTKNAPGEYTQTVWNKTPRWYRVCDNYVIKGILIERFLESIRKGKHSYRSFNKDATVNHFFEICDVINETTKCFTKFQCAPTKQKRETRSGNDGWQWLMQTM